MKIQIPKIEFNAPVVVWYSIISFVILLFGFATNNQSTDEFFTCYRTDVSDPMMWVRMVTYVLGHSDMNHYVGNFFLIILLGPMLEEKYGSKTLLLMMLLTAVAGGLINILITSGGLRGASGIVFMFIVLCSFTSVQSGRIPLTMLLVVVIYIGQEIINGVFSADNISQLTHIIGGVCGIGFGLYFNNRRVKK